MVNEKWAQVIVDTLIQRGIDYFVCAPGSRSTPLLMAVASHPQARSIVHFDERGLGFHALGYAKASKKPAVVVVTSGTAVANLLPAIMEADLDKVPLILLTADRPPELQDCGAHQTCDQIKLFTHQVRWQVNLPCPDALIGDHYLVSTISQAVTLATTQLPGPVHVNCMFREPLLGKLPPSEILHCKAVDFTEGVLQADAEIVNNWATRLSKPSQGLILLGSDSESFSDEVLELAEKLQWPIIADILSPTRQEKEHPLLISYADLILKNKSSLKIDAVIQLGNRIVSKTVSEWLQKQSLQFYLHLSKHTRRQDPHHLVTHRLQVEPKAFIHNLLQLLPDKESSEEVNKWTHYNILCKEELTSFFDGSTKLTEPGILWQIQSLLKEGWALFLANSMPIRDANQFLPPLPESGPFFGNRGVAGIDGNIATASGIVQGSHKAVVALLGDLSFLYDLNSLALLQEINYPLVICVINNQGGGIFSFLPIAERKEPFEKFIAAAHNWDLPAAAQLFKIPYFQPESPCELEELCCKLAHNPKSCLIEIKTQRQENVEVHKEILHRIKTCLDVTQLPKEILITAP